MEELLTTLLERLRLIGENYRELYDSEVRERMGGAIMDGFVRGQTDYHMPDDLGMQTEEAGVQLKAAIGEYIERASCRALELGLTSFHDRLAAFQNPNVHTSIPGNDYEEFFGHTPPEFYDEFGNVIRSR